MRLTKSIRNSALLLTFCSAIPALAQSASVSVSPAAPTTDDIVVLTISGQWPDSCAPGTAAAPGAVTLQGTHVNVLYSYGGSSEACAAVLTPWSTTKALGKLAAGTYTVDAALSHGLATPQLLGSATFTVTPPQTAHLFVPSFFASGEVTLASRLNAFNNGSGNASVDLVAAYDETGRHDLGGSPAALAPGASTPIATEAVTAGTVRFVELQTTTHVAFRAALERLRGGVSEGRVALPVFAAPLPAGSAAAAGEIRVSDQLVRANLTLFNAGDDAATFTATVISDAGLTLATHTYTLDARTTRQINGLLDATSAAGAVWVRVTADQPFLAYASATYAGAAPGAIPYEVFPARTEF